MRTGIFFVWLSSLTLVVFGHSHSSRGSRAFAAQKNSHGSRDTHDGSLGKRVLFDPLRTPIDGLVPILSTAETNTDLLLSTVTGEHSFIPPNFDAGDQRGPCPGLNALANHGYIGRNGVTSVSDRRILVRKISLIKFWVACGSHGSDQRR